MAFKKLSILPQNGTRIDAMFNPERYTLTKGVQIAEIAIPGLDSPVLQFVRGQNEKVTLELFFDTTDQGMVDNVVDVRTLTGKVYDLLKIESDTHAPPRCTLTWGDGGQLFSYGSSLLSRCLLESVSEEFTLFSPSGVPLRARLNVTFREYKTIEEQIAENPRHSADRDKAFVVQRGQTLSQIAWLAYGDPAQWRPIADENGLDDPRRLEPGTVLHIPRTAGGA
jgi:hypothetical protein